MTTEDIESAKNVSLPYEPRLTGKRAIRSGLAFGVILLLLNTRAIHDFLEAYQSGDTASIRSETYWLLGAFLLDVIFVSLALFVVSRLSIRFTETGIERGFPRWRRPIVDWTMVTEVKDFGFLGYEVRAGKKKIDVDPEMYEHPNTILPILMDRIPQDIKLPDSVRRRSEAISR